MSKILIVNGKILNVKNGELKDNGTILIDEGKITEINDEKKKPGDYETIDAEGKTIMPGLMDCHLHIGMDGQPNYEKLILEEPPELVAIKAVQYAKRDLMAGFTTIRDMGSSNYVSYAVKKAINDGLANGPQLLISGKVITATSGHSNFFPPWVKMDFSMGRVADGVDEIRKAVREQVQIGADNIKFCATGGVMDPGSEPEFQEFSQEEINTIMEEAKKFNKLTGSHAQGGEGIKAAVRAGVDTIDHGIYLDSESIELLKQNGTFLVPTLSAPHNIIENGVEKGIPEHAVEKAKRVKETHSKSFQKALDAGVNIALGTDTGTPFSRHGNNALELELMVKYGMSELEALKAATSEAARALKLDQSRGSIEEGKTADLLLVDGNPLKNIEILKNGKDIINIIKGGEIVK